jgi:hypothetical protein
MGHTLVPRDNLPILFDFVDDWAGLARDGEGRSGKGSFLTHPTASFEGRRVLTAQPRSRRMPVSTLIGVLFVSRSPSPFWLKVPHQRHCESETLSSDPGSSPTVDVFLHFLHLGHPFEPYFGRF